MGVYLLAKFEVSSIILTGSRQGGRNFSAPLPTSKQTPRKPTQIRVKITLNRYIDVKVVGETKLARIFKMCALKAKLFDFSRLYLVTVTNH